MSSGRATALTGSMTSVQATRRTARAQFTENGPPMGQGNQSQFRLVQAAAAVGSSSLSSLFYNLVGNRFGQRWGDAGRKGVDSVNRDQHGPLISKGRDV
jgi:hypothetical protein